VLGSTGHLGLNQDTVQKQIRVSKFKVVDGIYAGSAFVASPPSSLLPFPGFLGEKHGSATRYLCRLLRLDSVWSWSPTARKRKRLMSPSTKLTKQGSPNYTTFNLDETFSTVRNSKSLPWLHYMNKNGLPSASNHERSGAGKGAPSFSHLWRVWLLWLCGGGRTKLFGLVGVAEPPHGPRGWFSHPQIGQATTPLFFFFFFNFFFQFFLSFIIFSFLMHRTHVNTWEVLTWTTVSFLMEI